MTAYYNEFEPKAAAWLRELIRGGHIAPGDVDERSILDVTPDDLRPYTQCHFFAGIGVWSYALRRAGWPDDRPVWTGSCPCQPFSTAGKRGGIADERHLWPAWQWLVGQCRPDVVLGEQVASKDGLAWLDLVRTDLEGTGYAVGFFDLCAAGFGAPHIRQRLYFSARSMAEPAGERWERRRSGETRAEPGTVERPERLHVVGGLGDARGESSERRTGSLSGTETPLDRARLVDGRGVDRFEHAGASTGGLVDPNDSRTRTQPRDHRQAGKEASGRTRPDDRSALSLRAGAISRLADDNRTGCGEDAGRSVHYTEHHAQSRRGTSNWSATGPTNGFWRDADWLFCRDERWRPVDPGTFPLAHGSAARVGRLRGYGNAIVAPQAAAFIEAFLDEELDRSLRVTFG